MCKKKGIYIDQEIHNGYPNPAKKKKKNKKTKK